MKSKWRVALSVAALVATSAFLAPPVAAQKGVFGLFPAGTYRLSFAGADYSGVANNVQVFVSVSTGTDVARPDGAAATTTSETVVGLGLFDYNTFTSTFACLMLDHPSDFSIDNRLGSAALNTTLTPATPTCPGSSPLTTNLGIKATWTGVGPLAHMSGVSNYACAGYTANSSGQSLNNTATANLTLTSGGTVTTFPTTQAGLNSGHSDIAAQGTIDPGCGITGIGSGPTPAGHYRFNGLFANGFSFTPTGGFDSVDLFENSQSSQVGGGPAAGSSEYDLNLSFFGDGNYGFGCFAIPQSDATANGLSSATVHTTITNATPICANTYPGWGLSFPLTVDATWTATGPLVTVHEQNNYQCAGYTQSQSTFIQNYAATSTATVTMPDYFGNPQTVSFTDGSGALTQVTQRIQANGALPQACLIRG